MRLVLVLETGDSLPRRIRQAYSAILRAVIRPDLLPQGCRANKISSWLSADRVDIRNTQVLHNMDMLTGDRVVSAKIIFQMSLLKNILL